MLSKGLRVPSFDAIDVISFSKSFNAIFFTMVPKKFAQAFHILFGTFFEN